MMSRGFLFIAKSCISLKSINYSAESCKRYLETFLTDACAAGILEITDIPFASKQFVYQLKSFVFYPTLFGLEKQTKTLQGYIIDEAVTMFLARYQKR